MSPGPGFLYPQIADALIRARNWTGNLAIMNRNSDFDAALSFDSPVGAISVFARNDKIVGLVMGGPSAESIGKSKVLNAAKSQLQKYFAGKLREFDLPVLLEGTEFQRAVWSEISKIGFGETATYSDIAAAIGKPLASRAVGGAVGSNPVPLIVGCHRVLGHGGRITGYSGGEGLPTKRILLKLEGLTAKE